jgi:LCP family protein required for cell wall assembly
VKINEVHSIGEDNGATGGGPGLLKEEVSNILGVPIHYFVRVDFNGFRQLVDAIGGVDINVTEPLYDPYYPAGESTGYTVLNIKPGQQHMDGETALRYARSRETTSDFDRSRRQQEVMVAVRDKALSANVLTNPGKLSGLVEVLGDRVKTDLSISEAQKLAGIVKDIPSSSVTPKVIDNADSGLLYDSIGPGGAYILLPRAGDYSDIQDFANQLFSGGASVAEGATIELQNASGRGGVAQSEMATLTGYGYKVTGISNAAAIAPTTVIYDYSGGSKGQTLAYLKKRYGGEVQTRSRPEGGTGPDFQVVIGTSYATQSTQKSAASNGAND